MLEVVTQLRLGHQALVFATQAGAAGDPAVRAKGQLAIGQAFDLRRGLQPPVLATGLHVAAGQAPAPVVFVEVAIQCQGQLDQRASQGQLDLLALDIALGAGGEVANLRLAALNAAGLEVELGALGAIEVGVQVEALQAVVGKGQLLALEVELALRGFQGAGHLDTPVDLPAQLRPQLGQARQLDVDLPGQTLLQAAAAVDAVVAQADVQVGEGPLFAGAFGLGGEHGGLPAQAALEVQVCVELELFVLELAFAAQRSGQGAGQLCDPVGGVQRRQIQGGVPGNAVGKLQVQVAFGLALAGTQFQLRQEDLLEVATEGRDHIELARRAVEVSLEIAQVVAVFIGDFTVEGAQGHLRFVDERIEAVPGKIQPVDLGVRAEALLPVQVGTELEALLVAGRQVQTGDLRALGVNLALEQ